MKYHTEINISNKHLKYEHGFNIIDLPNGDQIWEVSPSPESDRRNHVSFGMCGVQATRVVSDIPLTFDQVRYLFSRIRSSVFSERTDHIICIWKHERGTSVAIGNHQWDYHRSDEPVDYVEFCQWLETALQDTFE